MSFKSSRVFLHSHFLVKSHQKGPAFFPPVMISLVDWKTVAKYNCPILTFKKHCSMMSIGNEEEEEGDQVHLMTLHASKGLEFPYVFVSGLVCDCWADVLFLFFEHIQLHSDRRLQCINNMSGWSWQSQSTLFPPRIHRPPNGMDWRVGITQTSMLMIIVRYDERMASYSKNVD